MALPQTQIRTSLFKKSTEKSIPTSEWTEDMVNELNIKRVPAKDFAEVCGHVFDPNQLSAEAKEVHATTYSAEDLLNFEYVEEPGQAAKHSLTVYVFFDQLRQTLLFKRAKPVVERKVDLLCEKCAEVVGFARAPFSLTAEKLSFSLGGVEITSESDLLVIENNDRLLLLLFEDKHYSNYKGKKGLWQICGEMIGSILYNANKVGVEKYEKWEMFGVRFSSEEVTFYQTVATQKQIINLWEGYKPAEPIQVHICPGENALGKHGLSLADPTERQKVMEHLTSMKQWLQKDLPKKRVKTSRI